MSRLSKLVRRVRHRFAERRQSPPRRSAIFDHVPKTGGTAFNQALLQIFRPGTVAIDQHVALAAGDLGFARQYPIISGHFTGADRERLRQERARLAFTLIRDPVNRAISSYSYWRHRIQSDHPAFENPMVQAAKTLAFGDFIRCDQALLKRNIFNTHYSLLAGRATTLSACEIDGQAEHAGKVAPLAAAFDVIGVTERLPESLQCFLAAIGCRNRVDLRALLARIPRNASPPMDPSAVSREDRAFIAERNQLDYALHAIAAERLDRDLSTRRQFAFGLRRDGN